MLRRVKYDKKGLSYFYIYSYIARKKGNYREFAPWYRQQN